MTFFPGHVTLFDICSFSFQGAKTGKDNGYTMLFDIESFDYSYYDEGSEGLKVALVHHLDMPIMRQTGFHIAPGTENQVHYFLSKFEIPSFRLILRPILYPKYS